MIFFYHVSSEYRQTFSHKEPNRPTFYWFSDRYYSLFPKDEYLYLFVKNPKKDLISLRARHLELDFNGLYEDFLEHKREREELDAKGNFSEYAGEPAILMSFSQITPDVIAEYDKKENVYKVLKPKKHKGVALKIFDENDSPIPFDEIDNLMKILPQIKESHPFITTEKINGRYFYKNWMAMKTKKEGLWL